MLNQIRKYYFFLLLINITIAANAWNIMDVSIGQIIYWFILTLGIKVLLKTGYAKLGIALFCFTIFFKFFATIIGVSSFGVIAEFSSGLILILVGATLYSENPFILYRQLISFFAISIPFMILQKVGVHTFFYGWSTELFHENFNYSFDEVKDLGVIFKNIPMFSTLFVEFNDLTYAMYQGRPTGLLYSNNVLSVIISLALALHFSLYQNTKRNFKYIIIALISVLTMSTLVYGVLAILFIYYYFMHKDKKLKSNALKTFFLTLVMLFFHYIFFPGLTVGGIGLVNAISFVTRFAEIFQVFGLNYFDEFIVLQNLMIVSDEESFSLIGMVLKNKFLYLIVPILFIFIISYYRKIKKYRGSVIVYLTLFFVCILTQFGVNFIKAPSFQLFLGVALYPIFASKIFRSRIT